MGSLWGVMTIVGPILLGLALLYALLRNRAETRPGDRAASDRAAARLRHELDREDKSRDG